MKIYAVRHGLTDWNAEMRVQGRLDIPLNAAGRQQAHEMRKKVKDLEFNAVYASPLSRATETAEIMVGDRYEVRCDDRLIERSFGDFEGEILDCWAQPIRGVDIDDLMLEEIPGGVETVQSMLMRATDFLQDLAVNYSDNARILIVGHGAMLKAFDWLLAEHNEDERFGKRYFDNTEVRVYDFKAD